MISLQASRVYRWLIVGLALPWILTACVTTGGVPPSRPTARSDNQLNRLQGLLPGLYGNFQQVHEAADESAPPLLTLKLSPRASDNPNLVIFELEQSLRNNAHGQKRFVWRIGAADTGLLLEITPRERPDAHPCILRLLESANGFAGETGQHGCVLGGDNGASATLRKEILIAPGKITLADRVTQPDGRILVDNRIEFQAVRFYTGWAGIRGKDGEWQLAQTFELHNDGDMISLKTRDGTPMGYRLQLARLRYRSDREPIMRLAVINETDERMVAYAWADPFAGQVGLNLDWFQAGLMAASPQE